MRTPVSVQCDMPKSDADIVAVASDLDKRLKRTFSGAGVLRRVKVEGKPVFIQDGRTIWIDSGTNDTVTAKDLENVAREFGFEPRPRKPYNCPN